jgi:hypothetical protein
MGIWQVWEHKQRVGGWVVCRAWIGRGSGMVSEEQGSGNLGWSTEREQNWRRSIRMKGTWVGSE